MTHTLAATVELSHLELRSHVREAARACAEPTSRREVISHVDRILISTSRHLSAMCTVVLDDVRKRVPDSDELRRQYLQACRQAETRLQLAKRYLYGDALARDVDWEALWRGLQDDLSALMAQDQTLIRHLLPTLRPATRINLGTRLAAMLDRSPSRPHPHLPHTGPAARVARRTWSVIDRVWDTLENRSAPPSHAA